MIYSSSRNSLEIRTCFTVVVVLVAVEVVEVVEVLVVYICQFVSELQFVKE